MGEYRNHDGNKVILHDEVTGDYVGIAVLDGDFFTYCSDCKNALGLREIVEALENALSGRGEALENVVSPTPYFDTDRVLLTHNGENYAVGVRNGKLGAAKKHPQYLASEKELEDNLDRKLSTY